MVSGKQASCKVDRAKTPLLHFIARSPLGRWLNTSAYHNQHHRTYRYNYGLYTVIWDRLHGTLHPKAEAVFDRATLPPQPASQQGNIEGRIQTGR
ncbi:MAG: sterol desaturase family protein [Pseudomonadota bacterium]